MKNNMLTCRQTVLKPRPVGKNLECNGKEETKQICLSYTALGLSCMGYPS